MFDLKIGCYAQFHPQLGTLGLGNGGSRRPPLSSSPTLNFSEAPRTSQKLPGVLRSSGYLLCYSAYSSDISKTYSTVVRLFVLNVDLWTPEFIMLDLKIESSVKIPPRGLILRSQS